VNNLHQRIELEFSRDSNDDAEFIDLVGRAVSGEVEAKAVREVFMVRIDNWFDLKWLNFSGIGRVAFGWHTGMSWAPDAALDEFRQLKTTFPPFVPDRVIEERCFIRGEDGYSLNRDAPLIHSRVRSSSSRNLHRRISAFSGSALFAWFSSKTRLNGRGSLMVYRASGGMVTSWYASFSRGAEWRLLQVEGIGRERLRTWITRGT
jgi:hypothetical protein